MPRLYESKIDFLKLSREHPGKWVAIHPGSGEVLAVGSTMEEVIHAPASTQVDDPIITQVAEYYGAFVT